MSAHAAPARPATAPTAPTHDSGRRPGHDAVHDPLVHTAVMPPVPMIVLPWVDPVVERIGHDARSTYVELYWLGILGPTGTWLLRRLNAGLDDHPDGYEVDLVELARSLGLSYSEHPNNPFTKALSRCRLFGLVQPVPHGIAVRRRIPPLSQRHLARLPLPLQQAHDAWVLPEDLSGRSR